MRKAFKSIENLALETGSYANAKEQADRSFSRIWRNTFG